MSNIAEQLASQFGENIYNQNGDHIEVICAVRCERAEDVQWQPGPGVTRYVFSDNSAMLVMGDYWEVDRACEPEEMAV